MDSDVTDYKKYTNMVWDPTICLAAILLFGCTGSSLLLQLFLSGKQGGCSVVVVRKPLSHCWDFSRCRAWAPGLQQLWHVGLDGAGSDS